MTIKEIKIKDACTSINLTARQLQEAGEGDEWKDVALSACPSSIKEGNTFLQIKGKKWEVEDMFFDDPYEDLILWKCSEEVPEREVDPDMFWNEEKETLCLPDYADKEIRWAYGTHIVTLHAHTETSRMLMGVSRGEFSWGSHLWKVTA